MAAEGTGDRVTGDHSQVGVRLAGLDDQLKMEPVPMRFIPGRYSHFAFGVIQSGLTSGIAAAIASVPFFFCAGAVPRELAWRLGAILAPHASDRHSGRARDPGRCSGVDKIRGIAPAL